MSDNNYTYAFDPSGQATQDKLVVKYKQPKEQLDPSIDWNVVASLLTDGYTDNRKVVALFR